MKRMLLCVVLALMNVACGDSKKTEGAETAKSSSVNTQTSQSTESSNAPKASADKVENKAITSVQNAKIEPYQNITTKEFLNKWSKTCESIEWEAQKTQTWSNNDEIVVVAYCKLKDSIAFRDEIKAIQQSYFTDENFTDRDFSKWEGSDMAAGFSGLQNFVPGGADFIYEIGMESRKKLFAYLLDTYFMALSEVLEKSNALYIAFPFLVEKSDNELRMKGVENIHTALNAFYMGRLSIENVSRDGYTDSNGEWGIHRLETLPHLAFEVNGTKMLAFNKYGGGDAAKELYKMIFFNKALSFENILEYFLSTDHMEENGFVVRKNKTGKGANNLLVSTLLLRKIPESLKEEEQTYKSIADKLVEIYSNE